MKKIFVFLVIAALLLVAPKAMAQSNPLSLGGMFGVDQKRLEVAPSVSFGLGIYTYQPPSEGFEGQGLIGLFSSSLGQYPVANVGLWAKATVNPFGFTNLEGVDRARVNNPALKNDKDWENLPKESNGDYSDIRQLKAVGVINWVYRLRHRDGRDRYTFLFITATWRRGDNLPAKLEMMVRREIQGIGSMSSKDILTFLNGFTPVDGPLQGGNTQTTNQTIPGQSVTATADPAQQLGKQNGGSTSFPIVEPPKSNGNEKHEAPFGVNLRVRHWNEILDDRSAEKVDGLGAAEFGRKEVVLNVNRAKTSLVMKLESNQTFSATIRYNGGEKPAIIVREDDKYVCRIYGKVANFLDKGIEVTVSQDGQTRTIKFRGGN